MPNPQTHKTLAFKLPIDLHNWLQKNHARQHELWVKIYKKGSGISSVSWEQVVIESLCWGWIDGVKKSLNDLAYLQRITPRRPKSIWSKRNTQHVERLITEGRMKEPGLVHVAAAKADGRWENAYRVSEMQVPADFLAAVEHQPVAKQFFETLSKSNRNAIAYGLDSAKKPETRQKRFENFMNKLINKET
ncbi:YdeI/OmpD-associated family protein [Paraglaciecola arctica]|uniref:YdeI/OmpD-associated family protein n=1 Tax=Paraglaciecola arctica TaxID=1128911 RepID=UPI001C075835|nr:YdeI/OmpD-associated family protein [Paraglaciecola arctica]MBU3004703.1 YdeI/OmpD-associated family protein [Paraglaciecola arctica]